MRRNLRLDWRALALLGALLSIIIAWSGVVFAMPALTTTMSNQDTNNTKLNMPTNTSSFNNYSINQLNISNHSSIQSDHSRNSRLLVLKNEYSLDQNESISAEFNMRTLNTTTTQSTVINTIITTPTTSKPNSSSSSSTTTTATTIANTDRLGFFISVAPSEHLAILSRTERSIRHQHLHQHHKQLQHRHQQQQQQSPAATTNSNSNSNNNFIGSKSKRLNNSRNNLHINSSSNSNPNINSKINNNINNNNPSNLDRNERSTISLLAGPSRKIQLYIKNRILQVLRDGTVNGTQDEQSEYTILQRSTVDVGRIKIQSVATCLYLCMDACGAIYAWKDFTDDCVFNENMELHNYNTYSSTYNSNERRVFYLALNRHGAPRRTQIPASRTLGKLSTYTNAITETVPQQRVEQLIAKNFGANRVKHGVRQLCDTGKPLIELIDTTHFKPRPKCSTSTSNNIGSNSSSSSSSSSSSNSSSNVPVPADSASSLISISNSSQSDSGHISTSVNNTTNISSSSSSSSNNNSSISNSSNNSQHKKNKKKLRKCRPHEDEEQHNCHRRPGALRKRGPKAQLCKERRDEAFKKGLPPPNCGKKLGAAGEASVKRPNRPAVAVTKVAPSKPRGGKKKSPKAAGNKQRPNAGVKKQRAGNPNKRKRQQRLLELSSSSSTTTKTTSTTRTTSTTTMASSLATPGDLNSWESSSPMPALALSETSDRVERNVRMMPMGSDNNNHDDDDESTNEDEAEEDEPEQEHEHEHEHDHEFDSQEEGSYEEGTQTQEGHARGSAGDDSLYYDQLDL